MTKQHKPVLLAEAIAGLNIQPNAWYIDGTFGRGGHTSQILAAGGRVLALDMDAAAIAYGQEQFAAELAADQLRLVHSNFEQLAQVVQDQKLTGIKGVLLDFGTSVDQLLSDERGFSFAKPGPLDMRMDQRLGVTAADLLAILPEAQLAQAFRDWGGEEESRAVAKAIVAARQHGQMDKIRTTTGLADLIARAKRRATGRLHPATKVFQALRIAVNSELTAIQQVLPQALAIVTPPARIVTIAFHEGEDRLAKQAMVAWEAQGKGQNMTKHPITPSQQELDDNVRARSAKLRIFAAT